MVYWLTPIGCLIMGVYSACEREYWAALMFGIIAAVYAVCVWGGTK